MLGRLIHKADGAPYSDGVGKAGIVRLNKTLVASIRDAMLLYRRQDDFFADLPVGINCTSGFIRIDANGASWPRPRPAAAGGRSGPLADAGGGRAGPAHGALGGEEAGD